VRRDGNRPSDAALRVLTTEGPKYSAASPIRVVDSARTYWVVLDIEATVESLSYIADVALEVLDALGHESADVLGYSLGGAVAQQLARQAPERVRRLALVSATCGAGAVPGSMLALMAVMTPRGTTPRSRTGRR